MFASKEPDIATDRERRRERVANRAQRWRVTFGIQLSCAAFATDALAR